MADRQDYGKMRIVRRFTVLVLGAALGAITAFGGETRLFRTVQEALDAPTDAYRAGAHFEFRGLITVTGTDLAIPTGGAVKLVMLGSGGAEYAALSDVTINAAKTQLTGTVTGIDPQGDDGSIAIWNSADELVSNEFSVAYQRS